MMNRRSVLQAAAAASLAGVAGPVARAAPGDFPGILDSNVSLFRWPFRRLPLDETGTLVAKLRSLGVTRAWAGSFEGVFHRDLAAANARLAAECEGHGELVAVGSINPALPDWERDLAECAGRHGMPGIRLHPGYHGYALADECFRRLLAGAAGAGLFVQLAVAMEDARTQPDLLVVPDVDLAALPAAMAKVPDSRVQLLNWRPRGAILERLAAVPGISFDAARADGTDGVASLMAATTPERVLFGSHAPFLIPEAALIRVHESALEPDPLVAVLRGNAERFAESTAP